MDRSIQFRRRSRRIFGFLGDVFTEMSCRVSCVRIHRMEYAETVKKMVNENKLSQRSFRGSQRQFSRLFLHKGGVERSVVRYQINKGCLRINRTIVDSLQ